MNKKTVFNFSSYKSFMASLLSGERNRGQLSRAAEYLNCQRSHLSRVMNAELQLTPDHAYLLTKYWNLTELERNYFLAKVEYERAASLELKSYLQNRIQGLKAEYQKIGQRTKRESLEMNDLPLSYFSSWLKSALHFLTSIPEFQTLEALQGRVGVKRAVLLKYLEELHDLGYIEKQGQRWVYKSGEFHIPKDSPMLQLHHQNWRNRALLDAQDSSGSGVHYTGVQTLSHTDFEKLKELLLGFLSEVSQISGPSRPEECVVLNVDLFPV